jgi:cytoskeleton protein RodZ
VPPGQLRLTLRFSGESWVEVYDAAGAPLVYQLFETGQSRELNATPPLRVFLGQAASVAMTIDGRKVDLPALTKRDATARFSVAAGGSVR